MIVLKTPNQAALIYSQSGRLPKQKHTYLVRFNRNGSGYSLGGLTFAMKSIDKPQVQPHMEEVSQYGKKRHIYTGIKYNTIKAVMIDNATSDVNKMWLEYSRYHFGDFADNNTSKFNYDVTNNEFLTDQAGFGFTANNGGSTDNESCFFFKSIEILQFANNHYDSYVLVHPKISAFDPDDLDYDQAGVSTVNVSFVYETYVYTPSIPMPTGGMDEFAHSGSSVAPGLFWGNVYEPPIPPSQPVAQLSGYIDPPRPASTGSSIGKYLRPLDSSALVPIPLQLPSAELTTGLPSIAVTAATNDLPSDLIDSPSKYSNELQKAIITNSPAKQNSAVQSSAANSSFRAADVSSWYHPSLPVDNSISAVQANTLNAPTITKQDDTNSTIIKDNPRSSLPASTSDILNSNSNGAVQWGFF